MLKWILALVCILWVPTAGYCTDSESALREARALVKAGNLQQAIEICNTIVQARPGESIESRVRLFFGNLLTKAGRSPEDAMAQFARIVDGFPNSREAPEALLRIGYLHDRFKQRPAEWERIVANYPATAEAAEAWRCLGQLALRHGDPDSAIADFQHSADMSSVDADRAEAGRVELGYGYISKFWNDRDATSLTKAISALSPLLKSKSQERVVRARLGRGEAFLVLGIPQRALMEYQAAVCLQPENPYLRGIALYEIGICYDGMDSWSQAAAAYAAFLSQVSGADLAAKDRCWKQARPDFARLVAQNPEKANALTGLNLVAKAAFRRAELLQILKRDDQAHSLVTDISSAFPDLGAQLRAETPVSGGSR
jgi:tetratricopeptide (TPR) repeat protein